MSCVVPGLLLASFEESFDRRLLETYQVSHVLNVAIECNVSERLDLVYAKFGIADDCDNSDMTEILDDCIKFIKDAQGCVLVHCLEGISRSVCIVIAYLVKECAFIHHLQIIRPIIDTYPLYLEQTLRYLL